jgi:hypothetical protein
MRIGGRGSWKPTDTAAMLWLFVAAGLLGWLVVLVSGHTIDFTP